MFSDEQKLQAVKLYLQTRSYAVTLRMLGYLNDSNPLRRWVNDYEKKLTFHKYISNDRKVLF
jgi:transposase-like protein